MPSANIDKTQSFTCQACLWRARGLAPGAGGESVSEGAADGELSSSAAAAAMAGDKLRPATSTSLPAGLGTAQSWRRPEQWIGWWEWTRRSVQRSPWFRPVHIDVAWPRSAQHESTTRGALRTSEGTFFHA